MWSSEANLSVNGAKSVSMSVEQAGDGKTYTLDGQLLHPAPSVKDLGVLSSCDLKSGDNMNRLHRNGLCRLWTLKSGFCIRSEEVVTSLFSSIKGQC